MPAVAFALSPIGRSALMIVDEPSLRSARLVRRRRHSCAQAPSCCWSMASTMERSCWCAITRLRSDSSGHQVAGRRRADDPALSDSGASASEAARTSRRLPRRSSGPGPRMSRVSLLTSRSPRPEPSWPWALLAAGVHWSSNISRNRTNAEPPDRDKRGELIARRSKMDSRGQRNTEPGYPPVIAPRIRIRSSPSYSFGKCGELR